MASVRSMVDAPLLAGRWSEVGSKLASQLDATVDGLDAIAERRGGFIDRPRDVGREGVEGERGEEEDDERRGCGGGLGGHAPVFTANSYRVKVKYVIRP